MSFQKGNTFVFGETPAASKWDQLWRNDDALADGSGLDDNSITTAKLADGSVTDDKLDFSSFGFTSISLSNVSIATNTSVAMATFDTSTIPAGDYFVIASVQFQPSATSYSGNMGVAIVRGSILKESFASAVNGSPGFLTVTCMVKATLTGSGNLVINAVRDSGIGNLNAIGARSSCFLIRVA